LWEFNLLAFTPSFVLVSRSSKNLHISPSNLFEISIGLILGDLHISNYKSVSARFQVEQGLIHEDYLLHLYDLFKDYCKSPPVKRSRVDSKTKAIHSSIRFSTRSTSDFFQLYEIFYVNGRKRIPDNIQNYITEVSLAYFIR
jgi:hypothetical protein